MKFCESLDRFVAIRSFTPAQRKELFRNVKITDKKSYRRLIINASVVNYINEIAPSIFKNDDYPLLSDIIEQELYNLCVKVNPSLDIKEITIFVDGEDENVPLLDMVDKGGEDPLTPDSRYLDMEQELKKRIIGQDEAVKVVSQAVRKARVGLKNPVRPIGSFIFVGQTGVGKTELAKALSTYLFGKQEVIRIDCSEYAMSHEYAKLIGAPPGYIGHSDGGYLTEAIKNQPDSVVVFDEIEKAHRKVHNLLLQILDEGRLTDSKGNVVSFQNAIIILTSNIGVDKIEQMAGAIGFGDAKPAVDDKAKLKETRKALEKIFPPEFLNRIDEIVLFKALTRDENIHIMDIMLKEVQLRLQKLQLSMSLSRKAKEFLVDEGTNEKYGARPLRRAIQKHIENPLAEMILNSRLKAADLIKVGLDSKNQELKFSISQTQTEGQEKSLDHDE
ncbi:MAG: AAA family ATPase [Candidatus Cloacimonetes bacterium]|nr:AAA family ATPase [Candidatus Cloacimonadota bacterium]